jgi:hypothetical protein
MQNRDGGFSVGIPHFVQLGIDDFGGVVMKAVTCCRVQLRGIRFAVSFLAAPDGHDRIFVSVSYLGIWQEQTSVPADQKP